MILFSTLMFFCAGSAIAQRPGPEFWSRVACEPVQPRTKLETIQERHSTVIIKGFTRITTLEVPGIRIDAVDMREMGNVSRAKGIVVVVIGETSNREGGNRPRDTRAFVDYEEIEPLLNAIDAAARIDETMTKLPGFEAKYRTLGDLEITVFRQTRSGADSQRRELVRARAQVERRLYGSDALGLSGAAGSKSRTLHRSFA
jgi:hypothetical protein